MEYQPLTFYNFFSDLIFHPEHADPAERTKCVIISIALGVLSLGVVPAVVGFGWGVRWLMENLSTQDKKIQIIAGKEKILSGNESKVSLENIVDALKSKNIPSIAAEVKEINAVCPFTELPLVYANKDAFIRKNLERLLLDKNELNSSYFIGIRGDGDCALRTIAIGFMLESVRKNHPINVDSVVEKINTKENTPEKMKKDFLESYDTLKPLLTQLNQNYLEAADPLPILIDACLDQDFMSKFNAFLRRASTLEVIINQTLIDEENLLAGMGDDVDAHLQQKSLEVAPNEARFFGNIVDCKALSHLLDMPISWLNVNDIALQPPDISCCRASYEVENGSIEGIIILNRGPHCDLILS